MRGLRTAYALVKKTSLEARRHVPPRPPLPRHIPHWAVENVGHRTIEISVTTADSDAREAVLKITEVKKIVSSSLCDIRLCPEEIISPYTDL